MNKYKAIDKNEIPNIPLYMDQVTGYLDEVLVNYKRNDKDKILTKTMINNYVKAEVLEGPVKKKYSKDQIMKLIMIYKFKNIIQISEIRQLFSLTELSTDELYDMFSTIENEVNGDFEIKVGEADKLQIIIELLLSANKQKKIAEELLDELLNSRKV